MAISSSIKDQEIIITTGQTEATCQNLLNYIRELEDDFQMMSNSHIADASGKAPLGGAVYTEIVLTLLQGNEGPWTIRFEDEGSAHTKITGGTFLATDAVGAARPVTTNYALTINQSISGTLVSSGSGPLTPEQSTQLGQIHGELRAIEGGKHHSQMLRAMFSSICAKLDMTNNGDGTYTMHMRDMADTKNRMTVDGPMAGGRATVVWDMD